MKSYQLISLLMQTAKMLERVGDRNAYQIYAIIFVSAKWLFVSLTIFLPSYLFITPTFTCGGTPNVKQIDACPILETCQLEQIYTITNYTGLYCDQLYIRNSIVSAQFVGSVVGLVILSILADQMGRKVIIVTTLFLSVMGASLLTIGTYYNLIPLLYIGIVLMGFGGYSLTMVSYSLLSEISCDSWRQSSLIMTYAFWAAGQIMLYPVISWIQDWLLICTYIFCLPLVVLFLMSFFLVETPQFYFANKRYSQCLESLNYIAKFNGKEPLLEITERHEEEHKPQQLKDTFLKAKYLLPLIVLSFAQACNNGFYYTIQYSVDDYGYRFEINMLVIGCLQFVSCFFTNFFCHKMKRKMWIVILMILSGGFGLLVEITDNQLVDIIFLGTSRLFNTVGFALFGLISSQTFPTTIRSTGLGITEAMSNLGNMGAPFLVRLAQVLRFEAVFVGGFLNLAGGASMLLVKETLKKESPHDEQQSTSNASLEGENKKNIQQSLLSQPTQSQQ